jgi:UDP-galactopyranose mutase
MAADPAGRGLRVPALGLVRIVGAGLAGSTVAHVLARHGVRVEIVEGSLWSGGQLRGGEIGGVLYEPYGAHIFHTADEEVWKFVTGLVRFRPYRHRVRTHVFDQYLSWPPQLAELEDSGVWARVEKELSDLPAEPDNSNFEAWCLSIMGETLYRNYIEGYTRKQWGRHPSSLSARWAPKRIEIRSDGYTDLFRDPYQGWPVGGYQQLINALVLPAHLALGQQVTVDDWDDLAQGCDAVVLTCSLDDFFRHSRGPLEWRGVRLDFRYLPDVDAELPCGVVNEPGIDVPYTRRIETKWMSGQHLPGTVVGYEYPDTSYRYYPIDDLAASNQKLHAEYKALLAALPGPPRYTAGRLASYTYIDMDQTIRQALNVAGRIVKDLR